MARKDPHAPTNQFGLPGSLLHQLRTTRDPYSNGMLLVWALRRMQFATWPEYLTYMRNETECPEGRLKGFVKWVEEVLPWVAAHERIDPRAVVQIFKECDLYLSMFRNVSYNLYTDPRKDSVTDAERCIRNHKLLRQLDRTRNLGGRSLEELLEQEVPIAEDRALLREVLVETGPGTSGRIDRKTFRAALARRDYNPNKRLPGFRRLMAPVFAQAVPEPVRLARMEGDELILDPIVVVLWRALQEAVQLLHAQHHWPLRRIVPARVVRSISRLRKGANGEATSVLTSHGFLEDVGRCSGGRLYELARRAPQFVCEGDVERIDAEEIWTAVVTTYKDDLLYRLPTELSGRLSGRHIMSTRELASFQENIMARASKNSADIEAVRKILLQLVGVMQSQFNWPGKDVLPAELIDAVLKHPHVQGRVTMQQLDSARVIRTLCSLNARFGFIWCITPDEPEEIEGTATVGEFDERDFVALVQGTFSDGQLRAICDQAKRKLKPQYLVQEEEPAPADPPAEKEEANGIPRKPTVKMGLLATVLGRFYTMLCECREWPYENVLTVVMVRSVAELVYPKMQTDLEFVERVFKALPTYGVIGDRAKVDIAGTPTDVYSLLKTSLDGMENLRTMDIGDDDLLNIIDELLPEATKGEDEPDASLPEAPWNPPKFTGKKRNIGAVIARDAHAWETMLLILEVMQQEFDWPFNVLVSKGRNIALAHCNPRSSAKAISPIGSRMKDLGLIDGRFKVKRYTLWRIPLDIKFSERNGTYREGGVMTRQKAREAIQEAFSKRLYTITDHIREIRAALTPEELATIEIMGEEAAQAAPETVVGSPPIEEIDPEPEVVEDATEDTPAEEVQQPEPESTADSELEAGPADDSASAAEEPVIEPEPSAEDPQPELEEVSEDAAPDPAPPEPAAEEPQNEPELPKPTVRAEVPTLREVPPPVPQPAPQASTPPRPPATESQVRLTDLQKLLESADASTLATIFAPMLDPLIDARIDARLASVEQAAKQAEAELREAEDVVERARARAQTARQGADAAKLLRDALRGEAPASKKATA